MQKHIYDLRYDIDEKEWRARAKRALILQLWDHFGKTNLKKGKMLDFGCGTGVLQYEFSKKFPALQTFGIDVSSEAINYCKKRGIKNVSVFDGKTIPFEDNTFNIVTAIDVLEHIKNDSSALKEIARVLKKGGVGILLVPAHKWLWSTRDIRLQHVRRYEKNQLATLCKKTGLTVLTEKNVDFALYFLLHLMCQRAPKKKGVADIAMETASVNPILNEIMYYYELGENMFQKIATFPIGISIVNVVKKQ